MILRSIQLGLLAAIMVAAGACGGGGGSVVQPTPNPTPVQTPVATNTPGATATPDVDTVNVVSAFNLRGAARIEVFELMVGGPGYLLRTVFSGEAVIEDLIKSLDTRLDLQPRVRCPDNFRLRIFFAGGRTETLGLVCFSEPWLLRGDDGVFGFRDAVLPRDFRVAFKSEIAVAKRPPVVASDRIVPEAVSRVFTERPDLVQYNNFEYERLDLTAPLTVGASHFAYQSLDWRVEVSWPVVAEPVFSVSVRSLRTEYTWEGEIADNAVARAPVITPSDPVISDRVLQVALDKLRSEDVVLESLPVTGFQRWDLTPEGLAGASRFGYQNRYWEVEVSWPVVLEPVYSVTVRVPGMGFVWQGEVLASDPGLAD